MAKSHDPGGSPWMMEDTGVCGPTRVEVGRIFDGTWTAIAKLTRCRPLVPRIACGRRPNPCGSGRT